jgi:hypothetical protein
MFNVPGFPPANLNGVFVGDGNELLLIVTDAGTVVCGSAKSSKEEDLEHAHRGNCLWVGLRLRGTQI